MDPYIILAKTEQGAWIETKEIGTSQWSKQEQLILAQEEDSKKGQLIYLMQKGSFQVIMYKMIRFLSGKLKKHTKLAKIVKISEIFNRLVFPLHFNRFCHPMTFSLNILLVKLIKTEHLTLQLLKLISDEYECLTLTSLNMKFSSHFQQQLWINALTGNIKRLTTVKFVLWESYSACLFHPTGSLVNSDCFGAFQ